MFQKMIFLIFLIAIPSSIGCNKTYTNAQCIQELSDRLHADQLNSIEYSFFQLAASQLCAENKNNPTEVIKFLEKTK